MLTFMAFAMVATFMALIMTKKLAPITALIVIPIAFGALAGFAPKLGPMMLDGIKNIAPTGVMLMFAILYFAIMLDAGLFDPFVALILRLVKGDPARIVMGTAVLALLVSLDGDGSTTYMITTAAMLPLYLKLGIRPIVLACVTMLAGGVMNLLPWGGPTARVATALAVDMSTLFPPMVPAMAVGAAWVVFAAWQLGRGERTRLLAQGGPAPITPDAHAEHGIVGAEDGMELKRPKLRIVNAVLTVVLLVALIKAVLPLPVLFMIGFAVALMINYPSLADQRARINAHAGNALSVAGVVFAAGIFTGILSGTKMIDAMAESVVHLVPPALGPFMAPVTALLSVPFTFFISNDAFYYGVVPILAKAAAAYGITPVEIGRASLMGQPVHLLSPLVPSTYLLVGLCGVELDEHQRFTIKWAALSVVVLLLVALATTVVPLVGHLSR
jgi:CitMHS family citrate-Mg2+:H+ or citrate-Ca2+:H+ symporter